MNNNFLDFHLQIDNLLNNNKLYEAFRLLKKKGNAIKYKDDIDKLEETYKFLLYYYAEGIEDNQRLDFLSDIIEDLRRINDLVLRDAELVASPELYYSSKRFADIKKDNAAILVSKLLAHQLSKSDNNPESSKSRQEVFSDFFSYVWTMFGAGKEEFRMIETILKDPDNGYSIKIPIIAALLLGNLKYFDKNSLEILVDIASDPSDPQIRSISLISILLIISAHPERAKQNSSLKKFFAEINKDEEKKTEVRKSIFDIIRCYDTKRITDKINNDLIPELRKIQPDLMDKFRKDMENADSDPFGFNPDWDEFMENSGINKKMEELSEIQAEGGDIMLSTFSSLKSFPFFNNIANWFLPFDFEDDALTGLEPEMKSLMSEIFKHDRNMCNSDKYSFALSLFSMPSLQLDLLKKQINDQIDAIRDFNRNKDDAEENKNDVYNIIFLRDLYRFFKLFRKKAEFNDPFAKPLDILNLPFINEIMNDEDFLNVIGEFYFKNKYTKEALDILERGSLFSDEPTTWEKIGYLYSELGNYSKAIILFKKSELFNPDSKWLLSKMAQCYRLSGNFKDALEYYQKALLLNPENYNLIVGAGRAAYETGNYSEALSHFHHADYLKPEKASNRRNIAWIELLSGNIDKAESGYNFLIGSDDSKAADFINRGHISLIKGNIKEAIEFYKNAVIKKSLPLNQLMIQIDADANALVKNENINHSDLKLIKERLNYILNT